MSFTGQSLYSENLYGVGNATKQLTEAAETYLLQQHFPGNVRELRNMIERAITLSERCHHRYISFTSCSTKSEYF